MIFKFFKLMLVAYRRQKGFRQTLLHFNCTFFMQSKALALCTQSEAGKHKALLTNLGFNFGKCACLSLNNVLDLPAPFLKVICKPYLLKNTPNNQLAT